MALQIRSRFLQDCQQIPRLDSPLRYIRVDAIIEDLRAYEEDHVPDANADEGRVSGAVQRLVRFSVDLRRDDAGGLHRHVIQRRSNRACADRASITACNGNEDRMNVWIAHDECCYDVSRPVRCAFWDGDKSDE